MRLYSCLLALSVMWPFLVQWSYEPLWLRLPRYPLGFSVLVEYKGAIQVTRAVPKILKAHEIALQKMVYFHLEQICLLLLRHLRFVMPKVNPRVSMDDARLPEIVPPPINMRDCRTHPETSQVDVH